MVAALGVTVGQRKRHAQLLLPQDDQDAWAQNPFEHDVTEATDQSASPLDLHSLASVDARIQGYESEHIWDAEGSMCSFR